MSNPNGNPGNSGGKTLNDRQLASRVRSLTLKKIEKVLLQETPDDVEFYKALLLKLAGSVLPRLNEHTGEDGEPIVINIAKEIADKHDDINDSPIAGSTGQTQV